MNGKKSVKFSSAKERFVYFLELQGSNRNKFYQQSGMASGTLDKSGGLTEDSILKICNIYPELSLDWLLLEKGDIIRQETVKTVALATAPQSIANNGELKYEISPEVLNLLREQQDTISTLSKTIDKLTSK